MRKDRGREKGNRRRGNENQGGKRREEWGMS